MYHLHRLLSVLGLAALALTPVTARASDFFQTNLVSDVQGLATLFDPDLRNPWGVSASAASPFWVSDQGTNLSTLYTVNANGVSKAGLIVAIPHAGPPAGPTGQVANNTTGFAVGAAPANFIFANLDGSISAWNGSAGTTSQVKVPAMAGRVYTGLALGSPATPRLYAADSAGGKIDVFNGSFGAVNLGPNAFKDPATPAGLTPFNVKNLGGKIYVAYAIPGRGAINVPEGSGSVSVYDTDGKLLQHLTNGGKLASPWGLAIAPASFREFAGDVLVGNFNNTFGEINAYDPVTGAYRGTLTNDKGEEIRNGGLWELIVGNGGNGGFADTLYFAAGIDDEQHGLFGAINAVPEPNTVALLVLGGVLLGGAGYRRMRKMK